MGDLVLDPKKQYAELYPGSNRVMRVFAGETIPSWAARAPRRIYEIPPGVSVAVGDRYVDGQFLPMPPAPTHNELADLEMAGLRLAFEACLDLENRVRALEGRTPVGKAAYAGAWREKWKELNP